MKIGISIPTNRGIQPRTMQCLLELVMEASKKYDLFIIVPEHGYTIAEQRNYIAIQVLNEHCDYLLSVDDDMTFPPDLLDKLMTDKKDIVGVAYHPRSETGEIIKFLDEVVFVKIEQSTDSKYKDTFECHATGTGIILIKCEVFRKIPRPWFMFEYHDTGQCKLGEDWFFCKVAKQAGYKIYTNPKIKCGHLGEKIY